MSHRNGKYKEPNESARKKKNRVSDKNSECISRLDIVEERINELADS